MTRTQPYIKQNVIDSFRLVTLINVELLYTAQAILRILLKVSHFLMITVHHYHDVSLSPKTSKPGNEDLFTTMGQGSAGGRRLLGMGRGGGRTYRKRYLISNLIRCCQATNDEKPDLKSFPSISYLFPIATSEKISWSTFEVNGYCFFLENTEVQNPFKSTQRRTGNNDQFIVN